MNPERERKMIISQCEMFINSLNELRSGGEAMEHPSEEDYAEMTIPDLLLMKRDLRDLIRSIGGATGRR